MGANVFTSFLQNVEEARVLMDEGLQVLAALAEYVISRGIGGFVNPSPNDTDRGKLPRDWSEVFISSGICRDKLSDRTPRGRDTWIGNFLSGKTDRQVPISTAQGSGVAILRRHSVRNDQKRYFFEVRCEQGGPGPYGQAHPCEPPTISGGESPPPSPCMPGSPQATVESATDGPADHRQVSGESGNSLQWE